MKNAITYMFLFVLIFVINIAITVISVGSVNQVQAQEVEQTIDKQPVTTLTVNVEPSYLLKYEVKEKTTYLGMFTLTAYCSCDICCGSYAYHRPVDDNGEEIVIGSSGKVLKPNHSIAVDPDVIPYGTRVMINGKEYVAEDCGGAIKGDRIDVYFNNHTEALEFGVQKADVYIREVYQ